MNLRKKRGERNRWESGQPSTTKITICYHYPCRQSSCQAFALSSRDVEIRIWGDWVMTHFFWGFREVVSDELIILKDGWLFSFFSLISHLWSILCYSIFILSCWPLWPNDFYDEKAGNSVTNGILVEKWAEFNSNLSFYCHPHPAAENLILQVHAYGRERRKNIKFMIVQG